jgi:hypothetical protein
MSKEAYREDVGVLYLKERELQRIWIMRRQLSLDGATDEATMIPNESVDV